MHRPLHFALVSAACLGLSPLAGATLVDFEGFANGLEVGGGPHGGAFQPYSSLFTLTATSNGTPIQGGSIFDSDPLGPNSGGADPDLLVSLGNILIIQNAAFATQSTPGIYDTPNDEASGGTFVFDFVTAVELFSIDLIDINGNGPVDLILEDGAGSTRTYKVPMFWTKDIFAQGPDGYDTLDLTILAPQLGEGGGTATAFEDALFDPLDVISLRVIFDGSAGLDNLNFIPGPSALVVLAGGLAGLGRPRRRTVGATSARQPADCTWPRSRRRTAAR